MESKTAEERLRDQIELNKTLKIKALSDRDGDKANMYQYAVQELQSAYHHILQPLSQQLAEKDKEIAELNQKCHDEWCSVQDLESKLKEKDKEIDILKEQIVSIFKNANDDIDQLKGLNHKMIAQDINTSMSHKIISLIKEIEKYRTILAKILNQISYNESMHDYSIGTETIKCIIDESADQ